MAEARKTSWVLTFNDKASKGIEKVDKNFTGLTSKIKKFDGKRAMKGLEDGFISAGNKLDGLSSKFRGISMIATGVAVKATKDYMDFSSSLSTVQSQAGATADEMDRLNDAILSMDKRMSSKQLADQSIAYASAGLGTKAIENVLPTSDAISILTEDQTSAPDVMLSGRAYFDLDLEDIAAVEQFGDLLAKGQSQANLNIADMSETLKAGGASFKSFNMGQRETIATMDTLADMGYIGSRAGTMVNATLTDLISKSEDGALALGNQTVALYDANGQMKQLPTIMSEVKQATSDMSEEQKNAALNNVFGAQSMKLVSNWIDKGTDSYRQHNNELKQANGALEEMKNTKVDNLTGDLQQLSNTIKDANISITQEMAPGLRSFVQGIEKVANSVKNANPIVQKIVGWGTVALAAGSAILGIGAMIMKFAAFVTPVVAAIGVKISLIPTAIGLAALKVGSIISAIGGVLSTIGGVISGIVTGIAAFTGLTVGWVVAIAVAITALGVAIYRNWDSIKTWTVDAWNKMGEAISNTIESIKGWWTSLKEFLSAPLTGVVNIFKRDKGEKGDDNKKPKHRTGKDRVPYDGYGFVAHKDEMVLTRSVANAYRKAGGTSSSLPNTGTGGGSVTIPAINVTIQNTHGVDDAKKQGEAAGKEIQKEIDRYFKQMALII